MVWISVNKQCLFMRLSRNNRKKILWETSCVSHNIFFLLFPLNLINKHCLFTNIQTINCLFLKRFVWAITYAMLILCGLTCRIILYNRPCTSQRGIALPLWKPLLKQQQYPARITRRFLIRAGAAAPLSNFALTRKVVLKRRIPSAPLRSTSQLAASGLPECIRQTALTSVARLATA